MGGKLQSSGILKPARPVRGQTIVESTPAARSGNHRGHSVHIDGPTYQLLQRIAGNTDLKLVSIIRIAVQRLAEEELT